MSYNITLFDPLLRMHSSWTQKSREEYFQSKVHELINSKFVKGLNLGFSPNKASFRGGNGKNIILIGNDQAHVISSSDIKANPEVARIHTEALLILSGQAIPGYTKEKQEPKKSEGSLSSLLPGFFTKKSAPQAKLLTDAHNKSQAEETLKATTPRNKPAINPGQVISGPVHSKPSSPEQVIQDPVKPKPDHFEQIVPRPTIPRIASHEAFSDFNSPEDTDFDPFVPYPATRPGAWRENPSSPFKPIIPPAPPPSPDSSSGLAPSVFSEHLSPILEPETFRLTPPPVAAIPASSPNLIIDSLKAENNDLRAQVADLNRQLLDRAKFQSELRDKISQLEGENASLALKLEKLGNDLAEEIGKGLNFARLERRLRSEIYDKEVKLKKLQKKLKEARALNDTNNQKSQQTIQELNVRIRQLESAFREKETELASLRSLLAAASAAAEIPSVASSNGNNSNDLTDSISELRGQIEDLESRLKDQQALESELSSKETAISALQAENRQLQEKLESLNRDHQSELENLHERLATIQALSSTNDKAVQELSDQIAQLESKFNQDKAEFEAQIRENNGQRAALERDMAHLNQELTSKGNRITVLEAEIDRLQRNIAKLQNELKNQKSLNEQLEAEKSSSAQRKPKKNDHVNELGRQIRELKAQLQQARQELTNKTNSISELRKQIGEFESELSSKETAISALQAENRQLQEKLESLNRDHQSELENLHERLATIQALSSTNDKAVQELSDQIAQLESKFNQDKAEFEAQIRENNGQRAALERDIAHLNQELTSKGNRITVLEAEIDRLQRNIAKLQDELKNQKALNEQLEAEKSSSAQRKPKKNDHVNELGRQIRELKAQLQQARQELTNKTNSISELRKQIGEFESELSSKETAISALQAENQKLQEELDRRTHSYQSELKNLQRQLEEALALNNKSGQLSRETIQGLKDQITQLKLEFNQEKAKLEDQIRENEDLQNRLKRKTEDLTAANGDIRKERENNLDLDTRLRMLGTELKAKEIEYKLNLDSAKKDIEAARAGAREARNKISELEREMASLVKEHDRQLQVLNEKIEKNKAQYEEDIKAKVTRIVELESELEKLTNSSRSRIETLESQLEREKRDKQALEQHLNQLRETNANLGIENRTAQEEFNLKIARLERDLEDEKAKLARSEEQIKKASERESKLNLEKIDLENNQRAFAALQKRHITHLEHKVKSGEARITVLDAEVNRLEEKIASLRVELQNQRTLNEQLEKDKASRDQRDKNNHVNELSRKIRELTKKLNEANQELATQIEENKHLKIALRELKKLKPAANTGTVELNRVKQDLENAQDEVEKLRLQSENKKHELEGIIHTANNDLRAAQIEKENIQSELTKAKKEAKKVKLEREKEKHTLQDKISRLKAAEELLRAQISQNTIELEQRERELAQNKSKVLQLERESAEALKKQQTHYKEKERVELERLQKKMEKIIADKEKAFQLTIENLRSTLESEVVDRRRLSRQLEEEQEANKILHQQIDEITANLPNVQLLIQERDTLERQLKELTERFNKLNHEYLDATEILESLEESPNENILTLNETHTDKEGDTVDEYDII